MNVAQVLEELRVNTNKTETSLANIGRDTPYMFCQHIRTNEVIVSAWFRNMPSVLTAQFIVQDGVAVLSYGRDNYEYDVLDHMRVILNTWLSSDLHINGDTNGA